MTSPNPPRNWKDIARELAHEQNRSKCVELSHELNQAIVEEERKGGTTWFAKDNFNDRNRTASRVIADDT